MMLNSGSKLTLFVCAAAMLTALGCAQQVGDIDRTQANALAKADFVDGEWYIRQTFSEVPPAAFAGFVGLTGTMEKIRWEITEDYLIAYRSYENNPGARRDQVERDENGDEVYVDGRAEGYSQEFKESAIAAYPITSHFDIQRSYNSSTGEQSNVIVENSTDRLWWERTHFRVDWTNRLFNSIMFDNALLGAVNMYVQESEGSDDALSMDYWTTTTNVPGVDADDYEDGDLYYMDFVNRLLLEPYYSYCFGLWYPELLDDCGTSEVEMRTSVLRVPAESDYEPIFYDDIDQQKFGYFRTERLAYDDRYGERLSNRILLGNRHNIWDNTWQRDDDGSILTDAEGRAIPRAFASRGLEPVVYHVTPNYPEALWDNTVTIANEWDRAFRRAVAAAQGVELQDVRRMFYLCHNPVLQDDPVECGDIGFEPQIGDLRANFIAWVDTPQASGPLGYGPSSPDPETGEIISGTAFVYGAAVDTYAQYALDIVRFINGDLELEDIDNSDYVRDQLLSRQDVQVDPRGIVQLPEGTELATGIRMEDMNIRDMVPDGARRFMEYVDVNGFNDFAYRPEQVNATFDLIAESGLGALAVDPEVIHGGFGVESLDDLPDEVRDHYFRGGALMPRFLNEGRLRDRMAAEATMCWIDHNAAMDDTIVGLAMNYRDRTDYDAIWEEIRGLIYQGVQEHEVGHTVGLRHNFQGSYDSINYHNEYWQMKTAGVLGETGNGQLGVVPFGMMNGVVDTFGMAQQTPNQVEGRMREFQYSTIMDYHSQFNMDIQGIGKYDEAAIVYAYTSGRDRTVSDLDPGHPLYNTQERGYVEVFNNVGSARTIFEQFEGLDSPAYTDMLEAYHYTTIATWMGTDGANFQPNTLAPDPDPQTVVSRMTDRSLRRYDDLRNMRDADVADRPIEVPYLFLSDYWRGASQSARAWDQGADPLEQSLNMIDRYRTYYPFVYFRRDRAAWYPSSILNTLASRYYLDLIDNYQRWLYSVAVSGGRPDVNLDNGWTFGAFASLNLMAEVLTTPSYGSYAYDQATDSYYLTSYAERSGADLYLAPGEGRRPYSSWDPTDGYNYWAYPNEAGQFWAYYGAMILMSASTSLSVRGADVGADFLTYSIPPYLVFEDEMTTLWNSLFTQEYDAIAPQAVRNGDGDLELTRRIFSPLSFTDGTMVNPETGFVASSSSIMNSALDREMDGPAIELEDGFTYRYLPMLYGMAFFDSNFSLHYHDQAKIFRIASGETVTPPQGFEVVQFCDPFSSGGVCYGAVMETDTMNPPLGARMILETQEMYDNYLQTGEGEFDVQNNVELMNLMRGMYEIFGNSLN